MYKKLWRWQRGRQKSGYDKMLLLGSQWLFKFDCYLLHFPQGCFIPSHTDPVSHGRHFRLNIVLKQAAHGGEFICAEPIYSSTRVNFFRPDISEHSVSKVERGSRYLLSIGWVLSDTRGKNATS